MARTPQSRPNRAQAAEKRAEAYRLKLQGLSDREVGKRMGVSHTTIQNWTKQEGDEIVLPLAAQFRKMQFERLNAARVVALDVLGRFHYTVSHGKVIRDDDGVPLEDDGVRLAAIDRLVRIEGELANLLGTKAPTRTEIEATIEPKPAELQAMINRAREQVAEDEAFLTEGPP